LSIFVKFIFDRYFLNQIYDSMQIGILKETDDHRIAITPDSVKKLCDDNNTLMIEKGAGEQAFYSDDLYKEAGGTTVHRKDLLEKAEILISIRPMNDQDIKKINKSSVYISSFQPFLDQKILQVLSNAGITAMSLDMIPRITIAQSMDVLSSMASISGYKAVLMAGIHLPRYFPMLTTAAGSIAPAKVLILGAGVAGLQAIATARRMGAIVEAFDTRLAAKEEVMSLGARFVEVEGARDDKAAGGYAVEQTEEYKKKQKELIAQHIEKSDVVISTALLRGKPAPTLITKEMVRQMRPGSVIVDLAAIAGGNCEYTQKDKIIVENDVTIIGISELSSTVPMHASQLYSRNIMNYLKVFLSGGKLTLDFGNEIIAGSCIVHEGEIKYKS
jgi:NAD(P) transhydrogenase subunit alpha